MARRGSDQEGVLCGNGNQALFGKCIASAGTDLELQIEAGSVHPDLSFAVSVRKLDRYNQTVTSDSASFLQIRSEAGMNSMGEQSGLAAVFSGTTVFVLQSGCAITNVSVRPFIMTVLSASGAIQLASEVMMYVEGIDNETSLSLRFAMLE